MSAITGWVDFERPLVPERPTVMAMTAALACRGPDGEAIWLGENAALGHRRLDTGEPGDAELVTADHAGRTTHVLALDGVLYNREELRAELSSHGYALRGSGDAEVLLHAFQHWGTAAVERLDGIFAVAVWDADRRELTLARDRLGVKPLYYHPTRHGLMFGSEPKALLANPALPPSVDADGLREILTFAATPGASAFRGIRKVRAGHVLTLTRQGVRELCYWQLSARPHEDDLPSTVATVGRLLADSVSAQLPADVPVGVLLSGGLDSSAITALAARSQASSDRPVRTFTMSFTGHEDHFTPDEIRTTSDDAFVTQVHEHLGARHTTIRLDATRLMDPIPRSLTIRAKDLPAPLGDMNVSLYLFCRAVSADTRVVLVGESADSLFGGNVWTQSADLVESENLPWISMAQRDGAVFTLGSGLFDPALLKDLDVVGFGVQTCRDVYARAPVPAGVDGVERRMRQVTYLHLTRFVEYQNAHCDSVSANAGIQARLPFASHRLWEYVYNVPWSMQRFDGREKSLLRAAVADLLPDSVLSRRKSPFPIIRDPRYDQALRAALAAVLDDRRSPVYPLLDTAAVRAVLVSGAESSVRAWLTRTDIEMVLAMDYWLRAYGLRIVL